MENGSLSQSCAYMFGRSLSLFLYEPKHVKAQELKSRRSLEAVRYNPGHIKRRETINGHT